MKGLIVKGIGGFYYVKTAAGLIEARGRGVLKKDGDTLAVGDLVEVTLLDEPGKGVIDACLPRKNRFIRPPIANVDMFIVVFTPTRPKPNFLLIDKFLIMAEMHEIKPVLCLNKCDLISAEEQEAVSAVYADVYPVIPVSALTGAGIDALKAIIGGQKAALAGPSGVGKSTILNCLHPAAEMETGEISKKTSRGRHTTRHVEIFSIAGGGMVYDTPGFTSFEILEAEEETLWRFYPEMENLGRQCRYDDCRHVKEPDCAVRKAVEAGRIHPRRYASYLANMETLRQRKKY